jgi:hypothetical protein
MIGLGLTVTTAALRQNHMSSVDSDIISEVNALVQAMTTKPSLERKALMTTLISSLKTAEVWDKLDCLYVTAAHAPDAARLNWKAPRTYPLTEINSPLFTVDRGYTGDGLTSYLDTGWYPAIVSGEVMTATSAHGGMITLKNIQDNNPVFSVGAGNAFSIIPRSTGNAARFRIFDTVNLDVASQTNAVGHYVVNRSGASARQGYRNGSSIGSDTQAGSTIIQTNLWMFRSFNVYSPQQVACFHFGSSLTAQNVSDLYNALHTYMVALGALS